MKYIKRHIINEAIELNKKLYKHYIRKIIQSFQKKAKNKITNDNFELEERNTMYFKFEFKNIIDYKLLEKVLKSYTDSLIRKDIGLYFKSYQETDMKFDDDFNIVGSKKMESKKFICYLKNIKTTREKPSRYVYHSTKKENRESILKHGIQQKSLEEGNYSGSIDLYYPKSIFVSDSLHSLWVKGTGVDVWEIDTEKLGYKWWSDPNFIYPTSFLVTYDGDIPTDCIRLYTK